jgi:glucans biosynthesis protein
LDRRRFLAGFSALLYKIGDGAAARAADEPFSAEHVRNLARKLANSPYKQPDRSLSKEFSELTYDNYRDIRFKPERALWRDVDLPFQIQFFHRGFLFRDRVDIFLVDRGLASPIPYAAEDFDFGKLRQRPTTGDMGFAGFRVHAPIMRPEYFDEVGVFLGASYFRAVAKNQVYGLSARALSISTGDPKGEEFPAFRTFWIERPSRQAKSLVVHALVDSKSASAALHFTVSPGVTTIYDVDMSLFPREEITQVGIGSLTSMFLFAPNDRIGVDDYRSEVHDSDGLLIVNGAGERIWRPLSNPRDLQIS